MEQWNRIGKSVVVLGGPGRVCGNYAVALDRSPSVSPWDLDPSYAAEWWVARLGDHTLSVRRAIAHAVGCVFLYPRLERSADLFLSLLSRSFNTIPAAWYRLITEEVAPESLLSIWVEPELHFALPPHRTAETWNQLSLLLARVVTQALRADVPVLLVLEDVPGLADADDSLAIHSLCADVCADSSSRLLIAGAPLPLGSGSGWLPFYQSRALPVGTRPSLRSWPGLPQSALHGIESSPESSILTFSAVHGVLELEP